MKRRAKLSLVSDESNGDKKDPDLGTKVSGKTRPASRVSGDASGAPGPEVAHERPVSAGRVKPIGLDVKRVAKVLFVVAVSALSIYLLRRRSF